MKKQNKTNFVSHIVLKSKVARSLNNNTGKGIKNTNLFILEAKTSSIIPIFLNNIPNIIIAKTGTMINKAYVYKNDEMNVKELVMLIIPSLVGVTGYGILQYYLNIYEKDTSIRTLRTCNQCM